jgi:hypothetical protein
VGLARDYDEGETVEQTNEDKAKETLAKLIGIAEDLRVAAIVYALLAVADAITSLAAEVETAGRRP